MASKSNTTLVSEKGTEKGSIASLEDTPPATQPAQLPTRDQSLLRILFNRPLSPPPRPPSPPAARAEAVEDDTPWVTLIWDTVDGRISFDKVLIPLHQDLNTWRRLITHHVYPAFLPEAIEIKRVTSDHDDHGRRITPATWDADYAHLCAVAEPWVKWYSADVRVSIVHPHLTSGLLRPPKSKLHRFLIMIRLRKKPNLTPEGLPPRPKKKKPVVYLFPPTECAVSVRVMLRNSMAFTTLYPPPVKSSPRSVQWEVTARPNGVLTTLVNGPSGGEGGDEGVAIGPAIDASYLYWEADVQHCAARPLDHMAYATVEPGNSVLVPRAQIDVYLETALKALGLDVEPRTSFVTFWLPEFESDFVALRFLPQEVYASAVPMDIVPAPDVVTRIFGVFRNVSALEAAAWPRRGEDWRDIVRPPGAEQQRDAGLFRVVEWGGMVVGGERVR